MKRKTFLFLFALLAFAGKAKAGDAFTVDNVTLPQNGEADVVVKFSLDTGSSCSGYTFWLQVPDGLEFVTYEKSGKTNITYTLGDCYDEAPTFTPNLDEGYLKVGCLTANSDPILGQTGTLVTFRLKGTGNLNVGDVFTGKLVNGVISAENGSVHNVPDATFTITISEPVDLRTLLDETSTAAPVAATGVDVRVKRSIKGGEWGTICLPFSMTEAQTKAAFGDDVQLGDFNDYDYDDAAQTISVKFTAATAIEANHPYIIKVGTDVTEFTVDGVDIDPEEEPIINRGTKRKPKEFIGCYEAGTLIDNGCLFLSGGKFWYSVGTTKIKAFRAYFNFNDLLADFEDNYAEARMQIVFGDGPSGISELVSGQAAEGEYYDLQGRRVLSPARGVYVKDGKKMVVK